MNKGVCSLLIIVLYLSFSCKKENLPNNCECVGVDSSIVWQKTFGGPSHDECDFANSLFITSDNKILMTMRSEVGDLGGGGEMEVKLLDQNGNMLWDRQLGYGRPNSIREWYNGYVFTGREENQATGEEENIVVFLDLQGNIISKLDYPYNLGFVHATSVNNTHLYTAHSESYLGLYNDSTLHFSYETMNQIGIKYNILHQNIAGINTPILIEPTSDSSILLVAYRGIYKFDKNGNLLYSHFPNTVIDLAYMSDDGFLYFGYSYSNTISKFNINSAQVFWERNINHPENANSRVFSMDVLVDGRILFVFTGSPKLNSTPGADLGEGIFIYDSNGNFLESIYYGGCESDFIPVVAEVFDDGNILLVGDIKKKDCDIEIFYGERDVWLTRINK